MGLDFNHFPIAVEPPNDNVLGPLHLGEILRYAQAAFLPGDFSVSGYKLGIDERDEAVLIPYRDIMNLEHRFV